MMRRRDWNLMLFTRNLDQEQFESRGKITNREA